VTLFSLQKGTGLEQVERNRQQLPITVFPELAGDGTFHDTAAIMQHLDLVISSDTAVAHLAGALGRPVWVLLARNSDWRWLIDRPDSPWYPTMRLFRQWTLGDWVPVFEHVVASLRELQAFRQRTAA
jgi:ADP-heptose:LPS heptosyltransferase